MGIILMVAGFLLMIRRRHRILSIIFFILSLIVGRR